MQNIAEYAIMEEMDKRIKEVTKQWENNEVGFIYMMTVINKIEHETAQYLINYGCISDIPEKDM